MLTKYSLLFILLQTGSVLITSAQETKQEQPAKKGCSCSFSSIIQIGALSGVKGTEALVQTVNGIRYKTWFAGAGIGLDNYSVRGYPLFVDVRKYLNDKLSTAYAYIDAGIHMPAKRVVMENSFYQSVYSNGFYGDAGLGYKIAMGKAGQMLIASGYSYKRVDREYKYMPWPGGCDFAPCNLNHYNYIAYLHRFSVKVGWQF
jgi:hypothetical protein